MAVIVKKVVEQFRPMCANMSATPCWTKPDVTAVTVSYDTRSGPDMAATFCQFWSMGANKISARHCRTRTRPGPDVLARSGPDVAARSGPDVATRSGPHDARPGQVWQRRCGPDLGQAWPDVAGSGPVLARGCKYDVGHTLPDVSQMMPDLGQMWVPDLGQTCLPDVAGSGPHLAQICNAVWENIRQDRPKTEAL